MGRPRSGRKSRPGKGFRSEIEQPAEEIEVTTGDDGPGVVVAGAVEAAAAEVIADGGALQERSQGFGPGRLVGLGAR